MVSAQTILCLSCTILAAVSGVPALGGTYDPPSSARPAGISVKPTASRGVPGNARINLVHGRMSANFRDVPLENLGGELSHKAGIAVVFMDNAASQRISAAFDKLPMEEGLRRILSDQDVFYFYSSDGKNASKLRAIWIYPKGKARGVAPVPPDQWSSNKDLAAQLVSSDPAARGQAAETLIQRKGYAANDVLLRALDDKDAQVRVRALYAGMQSGMEVPGTELNKLVQDSSADVRFLALHALADSNSPDARGAAEQLASDPNEAVRNEARDIISRLDAKSQSAQPQQAESNQPGDAPSAGAVRRIPTN